MKQAILTFLFVFLPILASADPVEIDGIYYNLENEAKTAEVTKMAMLTKCQTLCEKGQRKDMNETR